jgi:hypothetical protein
MGVDAKLNEKIINKLRRQIERAKKYESEKYA